MILMAWVQHSRLASSSSHAVHNAAPHRLGVSASSCGLPPRSRGERRQRDQPGEQRYHRAQAQQTLRWRGLTQTVSMPRLRRPPSWCPGAWPPLCAALQWRSRPSLRPSSAASPSRPSRGAPCTRCRSQPRDPAHRFCVACMGPLLSLQAGAAQ